MLKKGYAFCTKVRRYEKNFNQSQPSYQITVRTKMVQAKFVPSYVIQNSYVIQDHFFVPSYLPTFVPSYIPTFMPSYLHTFQSSKLLPLYFYLCTFLHFSLHYDHTCTLLTFSFLIKSSSFLAKFIFLCEKIIQLLGSKVIWPLYCLLQILLLSMDISTFNLKSNNSLMSIHLIDQVLYYHVLLNSSFSIQLKKTP